MSRNHSLPAGIPVAGQATRKVKPMMRSLLLWMLGIPIPIIILLWLFVD